jgi:uncharacterized membrane protein
MEPQWVEDLEKRPEEFLLAGIANLSFILGSFAFSGIMLFFCREKCEYVRFQIVQALFTQIFWILGLLAWVVLFVCGMLLGAAALVFKAPPWWIFVIYAVHLLVIVGSLALNLVFCVMGLFKGLAGKDFVVPIVGRWVFKRFFKGTRKPVVAASGGEA